MTFLQIFGAVLAGGMFLALIVGSSVMMAREGGWRLPLMIWGGSFGFTAVFVVGMLLAAGVLP